VGFCNETRLSGRAVRKAKPRTAKRGRKLKKFNKAYKTKLSKDLNKYNIHELIRSMIMDYVNGSYPLQITLIRRMSLAGSTS
jgi:hypothetical protein